MTYKKIIKKLNGNFSFLRRLENDTKSKGIPMTVSPYIEFRGINEKEIEIRKVLRLPIEE
tara:strand:- start:261 stop:440 length:180 start_codon:yes stop_codon:yes gene_type:complete